MNSSSAFEFLPQGALMKEFKVAGHNIILGFKHPESYRDTDFFGETIGRVANRITNGKIDSLNGQSYQLATNNGQNHLHGGEKGWGKRIFSGPTPVNRNGKESVQFTYVSPDGDEGYPGTVEARIWYSGYEEQENGVSKTVLAAEYEVELVGKECEETAVNVTNHSYFTLSGSSTIEGTEVTVPSTKHLPIDENSIPTGTVEDYPGIHANKSFTLGPKEPEIDHCFLVDTDAANVPIDTRQRDLKKLIGLSHSKTGLHLDIFSTEPAFQFYTGQFVDHPASGDETAKPPRSGMCIEPSRYINAINVPEWRNMVLLKRGQLYGAKSVYKAWEA